MREFSTIAAMLHASDALRRLVGAALDCVQLGPLETAWQPLMSEPGFVLRCYGETRAGTPPVLIVPAPIKRPYIFDLLPQVSVVRRLLDAGFAVHLVEWREAQNTAVEWGLGQYAGSWMGAAVTRIADEHGRKPILVGHSLGGTFAAIFAASTPGRVHKLLLICTPLRFGEAAGPLGLIVAGSPPGELVAQIAGGAPGSLLDAASTAAVPEEFVAERWLDACASLLDPGAMSIHQRVIRWTLDEFAQPRRLFTEVVELLYRSDAFSRGALCVAGHSAAPSALAALPVAAVTDPTSRLVSPLSSLAPLTSPAVFVYRPEIGVGLRHVGPLVGRRAHRELWPRLLEWMKASP